MIKKLVLSVVLVGGSLIYASAQDRTVTGTVTGNDGSRLPGVAVVVDGTSTGTVTDDEGMYSIDIQGDAALVFSSIGYETLNVPVAGRDVVDVTLSEDALYLEDVIVVAYGTASRAAFTGSATQVKGDQIAKTSKESIDKGMLGKMAGVRVAAATGDPGSAGSVQIRGVGSISGSTSPLYVVDGVIMSQSTDSDFTLNGNISYKSNGILSSLNPDDIESLTVLKDAAAASLYGSRAANGVIVITTKRGRSGKTRISYNGEVGVSNMANNRQYEMMSGTQFIQYLKDVAVNSGQDENYLAAHVADPTGATSTDWKDEIFRNAISHNHQLGLSAGTDKTQVYASLGYNNTQGIVIGSYFERISGRVNVDHQVNKWLKLSMRQMVSYSKNKGHTDQSNQEQGLSYASPLGILGQSDPTATPKNPDGSWNESVSWSGYTENPHLLFDSDREYSQFNTMRSLSNVDIEIKFLDELSLKNTFGYDYVDNKQSLWWAPTSIDGESYNGLSARYIFQNSDLTNSTVLRYNDTYGRAHHLSAIAGFEYSDHRAGYDYAASSNFASDDLPALSAGQTYNTGGQVNRATMMSILANANYDYADRYYLSASFRRDGSSRLAPDNRWANFWSVSAAWRMSEENFLRDSGLFTEFKLKASYGTNGNLPTAYYDYMSLYAVTGGYGSSSAIYWYTPDNADLGWEKSQNFNAGFEWNLYGRLQLDVEYYDKYTSSLLFSRPLSSVTGFSSYTANVGNLRNNGIEVQVSSLNISRENFSWTTDFNFTWQRSVVKNLPGGSDISYGDGSMYLHREGESMYTFYLPEWAGVDPENGDGLFWIDPADHSKGTTNNYASAGNGIVGKAIPDFIGGITNTFNFCKHFDFSFLISYQFGGDLFDYPAYFFSSDGYRAASMSGYASAMDYWTPDNTDAANPRPMLNNPGRPDRFSSRHIKSTDNIRVRDITFGYNIPVKRHIETLRVYFKAVNPFMIWSATPDVDPDVSINGYRTADVPATKSFNLGLNITF